MQNASDPFARPRAAYGVLAVYGASAGVALLLCFAAGENPFETPSWLGTHGLAAAVLGAGLGACLATATIAWTRFSVPRMAWARALHSDLRPVVNGADDATLIVTAVASGVAEELLFRGFLVPFLGVILPALAFGALHQVRGPARWAWMSWAALMGLMFGALYKLTGSLVGPIVAHVAINWVNLRYLRDTQFATVKAPRSRSRHLGGLLRRA